MNAQPPGAMGPARVTAALVVALLAAAIVAALVVYQARTPDLALEVIEIPEKFTPSDRTPAAGIVLFTRFDEPAARITIVGPDLVEIAVLAENFPLRALQRVRCKWSGEQDKGTGEPKGAPPGTYRLRVEAPVEGRDMVFPVRIRLRRGPDSDPAATSAAFDGCEVAT